MSKATHISEEAPVKTDWRTIGALIMAALAVGGMWQDIKRDLRETTRVSDHCAQTEDLTRFSTQLQAQNPALRVPQPPEYLHGAQLLSQHKE